MLKTAAFIVSIYIKLVGRTTETQIIGLENYQPLSERPVIVAFWHGRLLMISYYMRKTIKAHVLISSHRDGEIIASVQRYFGFDVLRGSTSAKGKNKGGLNAIRSIIKIREKGESIVITPDGPRGPARKVGGNIVEIAKKLELPIIPVTFSSSRYKQINSWDRFMLTKPFGRGILMIGEPIFPADADMLEDKLNKLTDEADNAVKAL